MIAIQLSVGEVRLLVEALMKRAKRHDAEGRARPHNAGHHDRTAMEMRALARRLVEKKWVVEDKMEDAE